MSQPIPVEYVEGPEEVTVWLWPNSPDPLTVPVGREEWDDWKARLEESEHDSMEELVGDAVANDVLSGE